MNGPTLVEPVRGLLRVHNRKLPRHVETTFCRIYQEFPDKEVNGNNLDEAFQLIEWNLRALLNPFVFRVIGVDRDIQQQLTVIEELIAQFVAQAKR